jgi:hypothetical protein
MSDGTILVRVAQEILDHLAEDGSGPVLLIGAERQDDGTYELTFRHAEPRSVERTPDGPWRICDRHGFSSPLAVLDACPDCHLDTDIRARLQQLEMQ